MASNGSTSVAVTAYDTLKFNWVQVGQNTVNNYTTINWSLQLISGSAGQIISSAQKSWSVTINGTTYSGTNSVEIGNNATKTLASGQVTITHNQDGAKSFSYSFSQEFNITFAGVSVGTKSGSGTGTLNTIPRATTPVPHVTSADMGTTLTIYTYRASTEFTHDLEYSFAGGAYTVIQKDVDTVVYWAIPLNLANSIPNTTSGTLTIRCTTKKGSAVIGTKTALVTVKVPATVIPTISTVNLAEAATGAVAGIGAYVQSKSSVRASITASGAYSSTVKSYTSTLLGKTYTGASWTSDTLTQSGTLSIVTTVTDSRGRTATKTTTLTVLNYTPPQITTFEVARYTSSGVADPDGTYARVRIVYSVSSLNSKNTAAAKVEYKKSTDSSWTTLNTRTETSLDATLTPQGTTFSTDYQWDFRLTLTDAFNSATPATYNAVLPSGAVILDIKADGKGVAFFKTSTKAGVEIAGELPGSAISLTTNANLNNLTTPGFYVIPTTTISGTITNKPYTDTATASIRVEQTGTGMVKQILQKSTKTDGVIFERGYDSSGWGSWSIVYSGAGKVLWTGSSLLTSGQTITFSEPMSQQQSGVVLVFSRYTSSTAQDYQYSCHFIPKQLVTAATAAGQSAAGVAVTMATSKFDYIAGKFVRVTETGVTGDETNNASGTTNGITYNNGGFALRYVIGV
jgi:hypothetical protein